MQTLGGEGKSSTGLGPARSDKYSNFGGGKEVAPPTVGGGGAIEIIRGGVYFGNRGGQGAPGQAESSIARFDG